MKSIYVETTATKNTFLKKEPVSRAALLGNSDRVFINEGRQLKIAIVAERTDQELNAGHIFAEVEGHKGRWYLWAEHWQFNWQGDAKAYRGKTITPKTIDWTDWNAPVSKYFKVGEVTLRQVERIPQTREEKQKILQIARLLDEVREEYGKGFRVTSWHRPAAVNRRIGGATRSKHLTGGAVDFYPVNGSVHHLQAWFRDKWFSPGRWNGGFGLGANKGFIHLDNGSKRIWTY